MRESAKALKKIYNTNPIKMIECGIADGKNSEILFNNFRISEFILIDNWLLEYSEHADKWLITTKTKFQNKKPVKIIISDALSCVEMFPQKYFNYIYLDDCHSPDHVFAEITKYWDKVAKGGILAGHDYTDISPERVAWAVQKFCSLTGNKYYHKMNDGETVEDWWIIK